MTRPHRPRPLVRRTSLATRIAVSLAISVGIAGACGTPAERQRGERIDIDEVLAPWESSGADVGLLVVDVATGETLVARNPDRRFAPASVTKLFTAAAALERLGPDHRFITRVLATADPGDDGHLTGALVLEGSGDPVLSGRRREDGTLDIPLSDHTYALYGNRAVAPAPDALEGLRELASRVREAGVRSIERVRVDASAFEPIALSGRGPYRATPITVNDDVIDVVVTPAAGAGRPATVRADPALASLPVSMPGPDAPGGGASAPEIPMLEMRVTTTGPDASSEPEIDVREIAPWRWAIEGTIPAGHAPVTKILRVDDPAELARAAFVTCLVDAGIRCERPRARNDSALGLAPAPAPAPTPASRPAMIELARRESPPLADAIAPLLLASNSLHAELWIAALAQDAGGATAADGLRAAEPALRRLGVPTEAITLADGSGLAIGNAVTPRATVALLRALATHPDGPAIRDAMPVLGVSGTLRDAVDPESPAFGRVRAKTGTLVYDSPLNGRELLRSKALAGWIKRTDGRTLALAAFVNDDIVSPQGGASEAGRRLVRLCEILVAPTN